MTSCPGKAIQGTILDRCRFFFLSTSNLIVLLLYSWFPGKSKVVTKRPKTTYHLATETLFWLLLFPFSILLSYAFFVSNLQLLNMFCHPVEVMASTYEWDKCQQTTQYTDPNKIVFIVEKYWMRWAHLSIDLQTHNYEASVSKVESLEEVPYIATVAHWCFHWVIYLERVSETEFPNRPKPHLDPCIVPIKRTQVTFG